MNKAYYISFLILLFSICSASLYAKQAVNSDQERPYFILDNTLGEFKEVARTPQSVDSLIALGNQLRDSDGRTSFMAAREALTLANEIGYEKGYADANNLIGIKYLDFGEYEQAMHHYLTALEIEERLGNLDAVARLQSNIAIVFLEQADFEMANEYMVLSMTTWESIGRINEAIVTANNIGVAHRRQGRYDQALIFFERVKVLSLLGEPDSVMHYISTFNIGNTYRNMGEYDLALDHIEIAGAFFRRAGHVNGLIFYNLTMAEYHRDTGNYSKALELAETALESANSELNRQRIKDLYELKSTIYERKGDYAQALVQYKLFHQISDSLVNAERSEALNEMQVRYDVVQKDREIENLNKEYLLQQAQLERQSLVRKVMLIGLVTLLVFVAFLFRMNAERKRNNQLLNERRQEIAEQNARLAALLKDKDDFLSIVAHDLRNPISIVVSIMSLMKNDENISREEIDEYIDMILISSDKMLHLVNDLLDIQSFSHGNFNTTFNSIDINEPLIQSVENFKRTAKSKDIELKLNTDNNVCIVMGNTQKLARVFDNLISNAIKYSPKSSTVVITTKKSDETVRVSISDEGPGISETEQEKLFGKFAKLSNKPTGNETSTGLGLYIVKKLVSTMNGDVNCISEPGKGSTFYVEFPIASLSAEEEDVESELSEIQG